MFILDSTAPAVGVTGSTPIALMIAILIAIAATAVVALGMVVWSSLRHGSPAAITPTRVSPAAIVAICAIMIVAATALVSTLPVAASADENHTPRGIAPAPFELKLSGLQLPTI